MTRGLQDSWRTCGAILLPLVALGCNEHDRAAGSPVTGAMGVDSGESSAPAPSADADTDAATTLVRGIPGYVHTFGHSRFDAGEGVHEVDEFGMRKFVGSLGVFAIEVASQAATAIPDMGVPSVGVVYSPDGYEAQNQAVVSYLAGAGLPMDQIASVTNDETGVVFTPSGQQQNVPATRGWFTILHRSYHGIPIPDSIAWAIFGLNDVSLEEQVYWPAIGAGALDDVHVFQEFLSDADSRAKFTARLPSELQDGQLVIRHTSWDWSGSFEAVACYCGTLSGVTVCFDASAHLVNLENGFDDPTPP